MKSAFCAFGVVAALVWLALALDRGALWSGAGLVAMAVSTVALVLSLGTSRHVRRAFELVPKAVLAPSGRVFVALCAAVAAGLSAWTVQRAMRNEPLSIDAGLYVLQARAMVHGHFGFAEPHPIQAFSDRFLLEGPDRRLYGIFPPGWPLALVPFVALGVPMAAGPVVAILLVVALAALGRAVGRASRASDPEAAELGTRFALLLSLASVARALETADLLSHAFVAALAAFAVAGVVDLGWCEPPTATRRLRWRALMVGACVGWVVASRLLDGVVLAFLILAVVLVRGRVRRAAGWIAVGAVPFVLLLVAEQHAATGAWLLPTQSLYFARSDFPPTCHRLGFGPDVGCSVEHPGPTARLGGDGYDFRDALRVTRERAEAVGEDLMGWPPLVLLAFLPLLVLASPADAAVVAFVVALTLAYGLFYYGNAMFFGARHLFPAAAFVWLAVARGATLAAQASRRGALMVGLLVVAVVAAARPWSTRTAGAAEFQSARSDLRRAVRLQSVRSGIVKTDDLTAFAAAFDPGSEGDDGCCIFAMDDGAALLELRRAHPDMPFFLSLPQDNLGRLFALRPPAGVNVEIERSWPTFIAVHGLAARQLGQDRASGKTVLLLSHAKPGDSVSLAFETSLAGTYALRVDFVAGPDEGDYAIELDGVALPELHGYAPDWEPRRGVPSVRVLDATRHTLVARCLGRDALSTGYDARLDALVGEPVER